MTSDLYGRIVIEDDVVAAYRATLNTWLPAYVAEIERQKSLTLPPIRSYGSSVAPDTPVEELPALVIVAPGVDGAYSRRGSVYDAPWGVGVGVVVAHQSGDTARKWVGAYLGALRACILQHGSLGGFATDTVLNDEESREVSWNTEHSTWAGSLYFTSVVPAVVDAGVGPSVVPSPDVTVPLQTVEITSTHVATVPHL